MRDSLRTFKFYYAPMMLAMMLMTARANAVCDSEVQKLHTKHIGTTTLCELQDRYKIAIEKLKEVGIRTPERMGNVYALRLVAKKDWANYLSKNGDSEFAAWLVYEPTPVTWFNWDESAKLVDNTQLKNLFLNGSLADLVSWFLNLHQTAMNQLLPTPELGSFRSVAEIIPLHFLDNAYTADEITAIRRMPYKSFTTGKSLMTYEGRFCDDQTSTSQLKNKLCGDLTMAPTPEVPALMVRWLESLQNQFRKLQADPASVDIIGLAANVQQFMIAVHPFIDGNGRTSRLMMDSVFSQYHLPRPILDDVNQDFFSSTDQWADLVGQGVINAVNEIEACAQNTSTPGCKVVSPTPPQALQK